jgi:hypothetical protein
MKKLLFSTLAVILLAAYSSNIVAKNHPNFNAEIKRGIIINIEITFGGKEPDCSGRGICRFDIDITTGIVGTVDYDALESTMSLSFSKSAVETHQADKLQYLTGKEFELPKDVILPAEMNKKLGAAKGLVLKAGSYPIVLKNGVYTVVFDNL